MYKRSLEEILQEVAKRQNITAEEVEQEIALAIDMAQACPDPNVQAKWAEIPRKGERPTTEELLRHIALKIIRDQ